MLRLVDYVAGHLDRPYERASELSSEVGDVDGDSGTVFCKFGSAVEPNFLEYFLRCYYPTLVFDEYFENLIFLWREVHDTVFLFDDLCGEIDRDISNMHLRKISITLSSRHGRNRLVFSTSYQTPFQMSENISHTKSEFLEFHRLHEIFDSTGFESFERIDWFSKSCEEKHRSLNLSTTDQPKKTDSIQMRHHAIQDDEIDFLSGIKLPNNGLKSTFSVIASFSGEPLNLEVLHDVIGYKSAVINYENHVNIIFKPC